MVPLFNISFTSVSPIMHLLDSLLVGKEFLTVKVLNVMKFCIILLCPKVWDPVLFSSRLLQNVSVFLLMEQLECFLARIIFLSMGEPFLIPNELVFLDLNLCWRSFTVIPTISLCDDPSGAPIPSTTRYSQLYRVEPSYME